MITSFSPSPYIMVHNFRQIFAFPLQSWRSPYKWIKLYTSIYGNYFLCTTAATAVLHLSHHNSVHLSHGWISQKWCKLGSPNLHHRLPGRL